MSDANAHQLYGVWVYGQVKSIVDQANQRKSEIPPHQSKDVEDALTHLHSALSKLKQHAK
jgi:hypothetical protein